MVCKGLASARWDTQGRLAFISSILGLLNPLLGSIFLGRKVPGNSQKGSFGGSGLMTVKWPSGPLLQITNTRKGKS